MFLIKVTYLKNATFLVSENFAINDSPEIQMLFSSSYERFVIKRTEAPTNYCISTCLKYQLSTRTFRDLLLRTEI